MVFQATEYKKEVENVEGSLFRTCMASNIHTPKNIECVLSVIPQ